MQHARPQTSSGRRPPMGGRGHRYVEKPQDFKGTMKKLLKYLRPYRFRIGLAGTLAVLASLLQVLGPWMLGLITSEVAEMYKTHTPGTRLNIGLIKIVGSIELSLGQIALLIISVYILASFLNYMQNFLLIGMTQNLTYQMRKDLSAKINRLPLKFFDGHQFGDILGRVTNDVETINGTLTQSIAEIFRSIALIIGIFVMMFLLSPILTAIIFVTTGFSLYTVRIFVKLSQRYFRLQANSYGQLNGHIEETYSGHEVVKVFNRQEHAYMEFSTINKELYKSSVKSQFISGIMWPMQHFFSNVSYILTALVGAFLVISKNPIIAIKIGVIQTFIQYTRQINQPIQQVGSIANVLQATAAASERIFHLLDAVEEPAEENKLSLNHKVKGHVVFKDVVFGYTEDLDVIKGFSAEIKPGELVAIVGPTGAGKTTMVNLLMRFYEIKSGSITIDGIDIRELSRNEVRNMFGMVLQDTWLFEGTIYENIAYGTNNPNEDNVYKASKSAQTHHFIQSLSGGYDYELQESGMNISQGQRQLITISRAMLANRPMLILDEATSSVDTRTEVLIQRAMKNLMKDRTSFVIAHRLSTIRDADVIFVMDDGNIIEHGKHEDLLKQQGFYANLYYAQFETN